MIYENIKGVPKFEAKEYVQKNSKYCVLIPIINEGERIKLELERAKKADIDHIVDIIICDGGSTDGSTSDTIMTEMSVNTLLTKRGAGKQGAQFRMGIYFALERNYDGIITIDGNNKDSIEDIPRFIEKLEEGYDLIQGSRFIKGGKAVNTPVIRWFAVRLIHAPVISLTAKKWYTDTTNAYRGYSRKYLTHSAVKPLRDIFQTYELLAYLSTRANQLGLKSCEIPVARIYPAQGKTPTKIKGFSGNNKLLKILFANLRGKYLPEI